METKASPSMVLMRMPEVQELIPLGKSTIYDHIELGLFPTPIDLGPRCKAWLEHEVQQVRDARIRGATTAEIKALVKKLIAERGMPQTPPQT